MLTDIRMGAIMNDPLSIIRLLAWLSPAFPTGAFSYSSGLEAAVNKGLVNDQQDLVDWLDEVVASGSAWNDAVLLAQAWRMAKSEESLSSLVELANAMSNSKERYLETTDQGGAFLRAANAWTPIPELCDPAPLPVVIGVVAAINKVDLNSVLSAFLHAYVSNLVQVAMRLMPFGQQSGVEILASLEPSILYVAKRAEQATLDDLGTSAILADIMAMQHEEMNSRIFRS